MSQAGSNSSTGAGSVISAPNHSVLLGTGTSSVGSSGPGATGTVFIGNGASADPSFSATPSITSITIANAPVAGTDGANKAYVDSVAMGLNIQAACYAGSTANLNATYLNGASGVGATLTNAGSLATFSIDGTTPSLNARILVKNQSSTFQNGIYTVTTVGSGATAWVLTRATDYDTPTEIQPGDLVIVQNGTQNASTSWIQLNTVTVIGTDPIQFTQFTADPTQFVRYLTGDSGGAIAPSSGNINIVGGALTSVAGSGNTLTINPKVNGYPITPYVVGPVGKAGYQTIQSAINAANAAGGGTVYIQEGTYAENLILYEYVELIGVSSTVPDGGTQVVISGTHTPPLLGGVMFKNLTFNSGGSSFSSAAAGGSYLVFFNCLFTNINGYIFDLLNWLDVAVIRLTNCNCYTGGTEQGLINNTGGTAVTVIGCTIGDGTSNTSVISGTTVFSNSTFRSPIQFTTGASLSSYDSVYNKTVTFSGNGSGAFYGDDFTTGSSVAITQSSSGSITLNNVVINSSNNPVIFGTGAGAVNLNGVTYTSGKNLAGTLTLAYPAATESGTAYLQNISFNRGSNTISTNGQLIIGNTGNNPSISTLTAGSGISITNGAGSITIAASGGIVTSTVTVSGSSQAMAVNTRYVVTSTSTPCALSLPTSATIGDLIEIVGASTSGSMQITQASGQLIHIGSAVSTTGATGTVTSGTGLYDSIRLVCMATNTTWTSLGGPQGSWSLA